jgi:hypothetical protein
LLEAAAVDVYQKGAEIALKGAIVTTSSPSSTEGVGAAAVAVAGGAGAVPVSATTAWRLLEDRPNKFGWVYESQGGGEANNGGKNTAAAGASLVFNSNHSFANVVSVDRDSGPDSNNYHTHWATGVLIIHYMRTYSNAGAVDVVLLCGKKVTTLDALWESVNGQYHKISIVEPYSKKKQFSDYPCGPLNLEFRAVSGYLSLPPNKSHGYMRNSNSRMCIFANTRLSSRSTSRRQ